MTSDPPSLAERLLLPPTPSFCPCRPALSCLGQSQPFCLHSNRLMHWSHFDQNQPRYVLFFLANRGLLATPTFTPCDMTCPPVERCLRTRGTPLLRTRHANHGAVCRRYEARDHNLCEFKLPEGPEGDSLLENERWQPPSEVKGHWNVSHGSKWNLALG